jgi:ADP-ribose pyrophosphatase
MKKVELISEKRVYDGFFKIDEALVRYERFDGRMSPPVRRLNFERGDSVAAIVFNVDSKKVLLVNQFKYPTFKDGPGWITETVAGILESGEFPEDAIRREILEEIGYETTRLKHIANFYVSPGGTSERIILFYAETGDSGRISKGGGKEEENEDIKVVEWTAEELDRALESGDIIDAKTMVAVMWLQKQWEGEN